MSIDIEDRLRAHLKVVAESTVIPPVPGLTAMTRSPARRRRRRIGWAAAAAAVLLPVTGIGIAAAVGQLSGDQHLFFTGPTGDGLTPDLSTVQRVLSTPGPAGEQFVLYATGVTHGGGACTASGFFRGNVLVTNNGGACTSGHPWWLPTRDSTWDFGNAGGSSGGGESILTFAYTAGPAIRAVVRHPDGHTTPVPVDHRWVGGWLPAGVRGPLELIGYDAAGHVVGHRPLWTGPPS